MDEFDKAVIRVHHWVNHGRDHLADYHKMAEFLAQVGRDDAAEELRRVVELEEQSARHMARAAQLLGPPAVPQPHHDHGHDHGDDHGHGHHHHK